MQLTVMLTLLLSSIFLFSHSQAISHNPAIPSAFPLHVISNLSSGPSLSDIFRSYASYPRPSKCVVHIVQPKLTIDESYGNLTQLMLQKMWLDVNIYHSLVLTRLLTLCVNVSNFFKMNTGRLYRSLVTLALKSIIFTWYYALRTIWVFLWSLITNHTVDVLLLMLLAGYTALAFSVLRWIYSKLPFFVVTLPWRIWKRSTRRRPAVFEKRVEGFIDRRIPHKPPHKSVLHIIYGNQTEAGYASCIRLLDEGQSMALLTAAHVLRDPCNKFVYSLRTKNSISISNFTPVYWDVEGDVVVLKGPSNWTSVLGCTPAHYATADKVSKSNVEWYRYEDGEWYMHNAEITDVYDTGSAPSAAVHSITEFGDSGTPYFCGKVIQGVHTGGAIKDNCNILSPLPPIPGLFSMRYITESPKPKGRIFSDEDIADFVERAQSLIKFKSATGMNWSDMLDDNSLPPVPIYKESKILSEEEDVVEDYLSQRVSPPLTTPTISAEKAIPEEESAVDEYIAHFTGPKYILESSGNRDGQSRLPKQRRGNKVKCCIEYGETGEPTCSHADPATTCYCYRKSHLKCPWRKWNSEFGRPNHPTTRNCGRKDRQQESAGGGSTSDNAASPTKEAQTQRETWRKEQADSFREHFKSLYQWEVSAATPEIAGFRNSGKLPQFYHPKGKVDSNWGRTLAATYPELAEHVKGFGWPEAGAKAELKSLALQASRWLERAQLAKIPSEAERERVIKRTVCEYRACQTSTPQCARQSKLSWEGFQNDYKEALSSLELDAGVGLPYIKHGLPTHRGWVEDPTLAPILAQLVFDRLQLLSETEFADMSPEELVKAGLCDPIRLFVKGEPHKQSKLDEGRYRLIMSVSLVDQLVARVLFQNQNKKEIALWRAVPSKPGFGLSTDEQTKDFISCLSKTVSGAIDSSSKLDSKISEDEVVQNWPRYIVPTDCSGFDWSVSAWMLEDDMEVRNRLTRNNTELCRRLRGGWLHCISNSVLCLSDGTLFAQTTPGVQKSGSYNTSSSNSRIRVMAAYHAGASWAMAMGDDGLESPDTNLDVYKNLGFKVEVSDRLEFCSHIFERPDLAIPVNVNKMLYRLIYGYNVGCGNEEVVCNYARALYSVLNELRHNPELVSKLAVWLSPVEPQKNH
nr:P1-P2 fusion protein [Strawberry polerovirus 1]